VAAAPSTASARTEAGTEGREAGAAETGATEAGTAGEAGQPFRREARAGVPGEAAGGVALVVFMVFVASGVAASGANALTEGPA
jgi:hypothetical protein